jgi:hypothetical protein
MRAWQTETGRLTCYWSEVGQHVQFNPLCPRSLTGLSEKLEDSSRS